MQQILYLIQKEFRQIFRDRAMLFIIFFAPIVQMTVLGFAITMDVKNVRMIIADHDRTPRSREIVRRFENNPYFSVLGYVSGPAGIRENLDAWRAQIALVIPHDFARTLAQRNNPEVQVIVDGLDGNTAGIALGYAQGILAEWGAELATSNFGIQGVVPRIEAQTRMWYNLDLESKNYMVPGLIAVLLTMVSMFLSSMALVREKEIGTLEQLMVTPIKTWQLILGKVIPFLVLAFAELALMLIVAFLVFNLQMVGSLTLLFALAALYLLTTLGLGIFISTLAQTQQQAMFISWFFMIFLIFMSGFFFPIENMPTVVQKMTLADPMRYFVTVLREIFLKGSSAHYLKVEIIGLTAIGTLVLVLSALRFQKRLR